MYQRLTLAVRKRNYLSLFLLLFALLQLSTTDILAQVTIGTNSPPLDGAILDLKEFDTKVDGSDSERGLLLPRVNLKKNNSLVPCFNPSSTDDPALHSGLMVYNVSDIATAEIKLCPGIYVWDSDVWERIYGVCDGIRTSEASSYVMDGQSYSFKFSAYNPWTVTIEDPHSIIDQSVHTYNGVPGVDMDFEFKMNVITDAAHQVKITFKDDMNFQKEVIINGIVPTLRIDPGAKWLAHVDGGARAANVISNSSLPITIKSNAEAWLSLENNEIKATPNNVLAARTGRITASNGIMTSYVDVEQTQLELNTTWDGLAFFAFGYALPMKATTNSNNPIQVKTDTPGWLTANIGAVAAAVNVTPNNRNSKVRYTVNGYTKTVNVGQYGVSLMSHSKNPNNAVGSGGSWVNVVVATNGPAWEILEVKNTGGLNYSFLQMIPGVSGFQFFLSEAPNRPPPTGGVHHYEGAITFVIGFKKQNGIRDPYRMSVTVWQKYK